jgi:hypothetical protein
VGEEQKNNEFRFQVGDIVTEGSLIATLPKSPMIGVVIKVEPNYFSMDDHYITMSTLSQSIQDRLQIQWLSDPYVESLPEELIILLSRNTDEK